MTTEPLTLVATYNRTIHASVERIWENVRDWEHLPWLHRPSFLSVKLLEQTLSSWRAQITMPPAATPREAVIEIQMDQPHLRYWSRTLEGQGSGGEILTCLTPVETQETNIIVEFRARVENDKQAQALGAAYLRLYERLWDEDERMMQRRQELLDAGKIGVEPRRLCSTKPIHLKET
jgi:hypothetical protein